jgi:hypothetical protein
MGYSTQYKGSLKFHRDLTGSELAMVGDVFGKDCRDHPDWPDDGYPYLSYVDLKFTDRFDGIEWDGSEKSSPLNHVVNVITEVIRRKMPDFTLTGEMAAQGEDVDDRWTLVMRDGRAERVDCKPSGAAVMCPHCDGKVYVDEAEPYE